uniref:Uncharacterized protein n=1 Tax=Peronospora matthiolae TaxID=2874970 RepID=A0AAV1T6Z1_9STRA
MYDFLERADSVRPVVIVQSEEKTVRFVIELEVKCLTVTHLCPNMWVTNPARGLQRGSSLM